MPAATTRRGFLAGAAAGSAIPLAAALSEAGAATAPACVPKSPGIRRTSLAAGRSGDAVWTADAGSTTISRHRLRGLALADSIDVGGAPFDLAISPRGRYALVTTAAWDRPGLAVADLLAGQADRLDAGPAPHSVAFSPDGRTGWVTGGGAEGTLRRVGLHGRGDGRAVPIGSHPQGIAVMPGGERALIALNGAAAISFAALGRKPHPARLIETEPYPSRIAITPDGRTAFVTHNHFGADAISVIDLVKGRAVRTVRTGADPADLVVTPSGDGAVVACAGDGTVRVWAGRGRSRTYEVGGAPRAVTVIRGRCVAVDGDSGRLHSIRLPRWAR